MPLRKERGYCKNTSAALFLYSSLSLSVVAYFYTFLSIIMIGCNFVSLSPVAYFYTFLSIIMIGCNFVSRGSFENNGFKNEGFTKRGFNKKGTSNGGVVSLFSYPK